MAGLHAVARRRPVPFPLLWAERTRSKLDKYLIYQVFCTHMQTFSPEIRFFLDLAKTQSMLNRRFDAGLGGISFSWFVIMCHLSEARDEKMRRIDLAEKVGLTASGVTRLLGPMEKIGLVRSEPSEHDARVSLIALAPGGKRKLEEAVEDAALLIEDLVPADRRRGIADLSAFLAEVASRVK